MLVPILCDTKGNATFGKGNVTGAMLRSLCLTKTGNDI